MSLAFDIARTISADIAPEPDSGALTNVWLMIEIDNYWNRSRPMIH